MADERIRVMLAKDRLAAEQLFHDRQAHGRASSFLGNTALRFDDDWYLDHETWIRPAVDRLGNVSGLPVLDYGCGHGMASVVLARRGARVTAFDLSRGYLEEARRRAAANNVRIALVQADAERLPFAEGSFGRVWGNAILHHLDVRQAARELYRVLQPGGIAVFCEPWGENPLLAWARRRWPYCGKDRTPDEQPLRRHHLRLLHEVFPSLQVEGYQLLSMARRVLRAKRLFQNGDATPKIQESRPRFGTVSKRVVSGLEWCDNRLLRLAPSLSRYCRYVVLTLRR